MKLSSWTSWPVVSDRPDAFRPGYARSNQVILVWLILVAILGGALWVLICRLHQDQGAGNSLTDQAIPLLFSDSPPSSSLPSRSSSPFARLTPAVPGSQTGETYRHKATNRAVFYLDGVEVLSLKLYLGQPVVQFSLVTKPSVVFETTPDRGIAFVDSDCPDKVCVHTGVLKSPNSMAACLPNHLVLVIESIDTD